MKKKILLINLFTLLILIVAPFVSAYSTGIEQPPIQNTATLQQNILMKEHTEEPLATAYVVVFALTYSQSAGLQPCQGATVHVKGILHSYNGTTNEQGIYLFAVHTSLLRDKFYFITITMTQGDHVATKRAFFHVRARQIVFKGFLFLVLDNS